MSIFKRTIKHSRPSTQINNKIKNLDEDLKKTKTNPSDYDLPEEKSDEIVLSENWREIFNEETVPEHQQQIDEIRERHNDLIKVQGSIEYVKNKEVRKIFNELYQDEVEKVVDTYVSKYSNDIIDLREDLFHEIKKKPSIDLGVLEEKINLLTLKYNQLSEGLLNEPTPNLEDPITLKQLKDHYQLLVSRLQEQLSTLGGGGEVRLEFLDDVDRDTAKVNGKYLKYNSSLGKFVGADAGAGSQTLNETLGFGNTSSLGMSVGVITATSFSGSGANLTDLPNTGIGTTGSVNTTGVITATTFVGDGSGLTNITADASGVQIQNSGSAVGTATTINFFGSNFNASISGGIASITASSGDVVADTSPQLGGNLDLNSKNINGTGNVDINGNITATSFSGIGSNLTSLDATNIIGTLSNDLLDNIPNSKLENSSVSFGNISVNLGGGDSTPAFDLSDATNYPTSSLSGTITNAQLAGSIDDSKLASTFLKNVVEDTTPQLGGNLDINSKDIVGIGSISITGVITATSANFSGNVSIGGTLTYEDVTNVDSIGLITARNGISVTSGGINVSSGVITATSFSGSGANLTDLPNTGIGTTGSVNTTGVITATTFVGDGSGLTGVTASGTGVVVQEEGSNIGTASTINFIGSNVTAALSGGIANVTISGGISNVVEDTSPQLGGNLDVNGKDITGTGNVNLTGVITATSFSGDLATTDLTGTITNAQLAGSIDNGKLSNSSVNYGGITLSLGGSDATPAFDLSDATAYPYTSLTGITTTILGDTTPQLGGNLDVNGKDITGTGNVNLTGVITATSFSGDGSALTNLPVSGITTASSNVQVTWNVTSSGSSAYRFTGPGNDAADDNPDIYLIRGQRYRFTNNSGGSHPFEIRSSAGGSSYSTGVTNNGAASGNIDFNVQHDAPERLYYQCTSHSGMVGNIYIVGGSDWRMTDVNTSTAPEIYTTRNVGIGTDNPAEKLDVVGTVKATAFSGDLATTNLTGTITNAQLAGSIANAKLANDSVSYGGVSVDLGSSDATPAFDLSDATNYPYTSLTGITTEIVGDTTPQLGGNLDVNSKDITGTGNVNLTGIITATSANFSGNVSIGGTLTYEDVTNVDSIGLITARNGISVTSGGINVSSGVVTATSFTGTINTASQTNITSVGTLSALTVSGVADIGTPANTNSNSAFLVTANGSSAYRFTGPGNSGSDDNPDLYLIRGQRYTFTNNSGGSHPFEIRSSSGGSAYSDGVTNNGASSGDIVFNVQHDVPAQLYYQCTSHSGMVGNIYIVGGPQIISGIITATSFSGSGANLTALNASNLGSGTVPDARFPATLPAISGANLTSLTGASAATYGNATNVAQVTVDANGRITGITNVAISGAGGGGGSGTFDTGITTSIYTSVTGGIGTAQAGLSTTAANNDIFIGPGIAYSFPSTAGKSYVIESIHITNIYNTNLFVSARQDFNGGQNVPTSQRVVVPYQGSLELLEEPIIAKPSDVLRLQALSGVGTTATGVNNGLDSFIIYSEKTDTNYIGTGVTVSTPAGTEMFTSNTNPSVIQSLRLCNYDLNIDVDASVSIYRGGSVGGILTTGVRQGYLVYNMTIPKNSVIEVLERPKYLAANDTIVVGIAGTTLTNSLSATLSGKYIT